MNEISAVLVRTPGTPGDLTSLLQHIAKVAQRFFASDICVTLAFNPITGRFISQQTVIQEFPVAHKVVNARPKSGGVTQQIMREGFLLVEDPELQPQYYSRFTRQGGIRAFAGLAMLTRHRKRPLGVIYLDFKQPRTFSASEEDSFRLFAVEASFLI